MVLRSVNETNHLVLHITEIHQPILTVLLETKEQQCKFKEKSCMVLKQRVIAQDLNAWTLLQSKTLRCKTCMNM